MKTSSRYLEPLSHATDEVQEYLSQRPKRSIAGVILAAILVGLFIWAWPELHRTIHIHRM